MQMENKSIFSIPKEKKMYSLNTARLLSVLPSARLNTVSVRNSDYWINLIFFYRSYQKSFFAHNDAILCLKIRKINK